MKAFLKIMKIQIETTSKSLRELLTPAQLDIIRNCKDSSVHRIVLMNSDSSPIYLEFGAEATIDNGFPLATNTGLEYSDVNLSDLHFISQNPNAELRLLIN